MGLDLGRVVLQPGGVRPEPSQQPRFKLLVRGGPRHGMAGMRHQPEFNVAGRGRGDQLGMPWSDIPVIRAMD